LSWQSIASSGNGSELVAGTLDQGLWSSSATVTNISTTVSTGSLAGGAGTALQLIYIGGGQFLTVNQQGVISAD
jgi:hypothetical protein